MSILNYLKSFQMFENNQMNRFNDIYQELYNRLQEQGVGDKIINSVKGRLYGARNLIEKFNLQDKIVNATNLDSLLDLLGQLADIQKSQRGVKKEPDQTLSEKDQIKQKYPRKYQEMFDVVFKKEFDAEVATTMLSVLNNLKLALENQGRDKEVMDAKSVEDVYDIIHRVELVSKSNKWAEMISKTSLRHEVKSRIEEFADVVATFDNEKSYKQFLGNSIIRKDFDDFINAFKDWIELLGSGRGEIINKIDDVEGIVVEQLLKNQIIAWVYTKKASQEMGSTNWCISYKDTGRNQFDNYVYQEMRKQYFVWDFDYPVTDPKYFCGVTLNEQGKVHSASDNNNSGINSYVPTTSWFPKLYPVTHDQLKIWIKQIRADNMTHPNWKAPLLMFAEEEDIESFKNVVEAHKIDFARDGVLAKNLLIEAIDTNNIDIARIVLDNNAQACSNNHGEALAHAYDSNKPEFFNIIKSSIPPSTMKVANKLVKRKPQIQNLLDYYAKKM